MSKKLAAKRKNFVWAAIVNILLPAVDKHAERWQ